MNNPYPANGLSDALQVQLEAQVQHAQLQAQRRWFWLGMTTILLTILLAWVGIPAMMSTRVVAEAHAWAIWVLTFGMLLGGFFHWRGYRVMSDAATRSLRERVLGRLIQAEWKAEAAAEKAKRTLTLSDDGELVEADDLPDEAPAQPARKVMG
jgi:uncharacterized membrane protein (DUF485 family)